MKKTKTIKQQLKRPYYFVALLPFLFLIFTATIMNRIVLGPDKAAFHELYLKGQEDGMVTMLPVILGVSLAIIILAVMVFNIYTTRKLVRRITEPIDILDRAAKEIVNGNYNFPVQYHRDDEFKKVCDSFNEMSKRLYASILKQRILEENRKIFLAGISHDLKTPLTAVKGYVEGIQDGVPSTPEMQKRYLSIIHRKTLEIENLIERIFELSKLEITDYPFHFQVILAQESFTRIEELIEQQSLQQVVHVTYESNLGQESFVKIDENEINRVLINLIENSVKYSGETVCHVKITWSEDNHQFKLIVQDNGIGVKSENLPFIFDSFYREDPARMESHQGSGIGLAIAKKIIEAHDGKIFAENDNGLKITILLPRHYEEEIRDA
ncbi:hypothetical protein AwErysi_09150 [Erysipelotrichaceae bacterium]|nr:hypothetical protein AwErysi_09150 [Erysipelotrichaceae bacterium]